METQCLLNYDVLSIGEEHRVYLLVRVKGGKGNEGRESLPLNLSVVIDRSGSMQGDKLEYVKQAAEDLIRRLGAKDRLSLIAYDTTVEVLVPPMTVEDKTLLSQAVRKLHAKATTNLSGGWLQGCEFVGQKIGKDCVNRVLLLSDGLANVGVQDPTTLASMARQKRTEGITTTAFGVGMDFNEDLLSRMALEGGGAFYFIDSPDQAPAFFGEELQDLYNVIGQNLSVTLDCEKPIKGVQQLYDYPREQQNGVLVYRLGDIYAEEERYQVFELTLAPLKKGKTKLGTVRVSYDAIDEDKVKHAESAFEIYIHASPEKELIVSMPKVDVEKLALLQKAARAREKAVQHADNQQFEEAAACMREIASILKSSAIEDEELQAEHDRLIEEAMDMELGRQRYDAAMRKIHKSRSHYSHRHQRYSQVAANMHVRHKLAKVAIERGGLPPSIIQWGRESRDLVGEKISIGSATDNDIVLQDPQVDIHHCRMERQGKDWYLVHLSNRKDTFANSGLVDRRFRLSAGDVMTVGKTLFQFSRLDSVVEPKAKGDEQEAAKLLRRGQRMEKRGDFPTAVDCYLRILALNPSKTFTMYFANNNLGFSLNQLGKYTEAEPYCREAIAINDRRHNAHKNLGVSMQGQGRYPEAAEAYLAAIEREPGDPRALNHLEELYQAHPDIAAHVQDFEARLKECRMLAAASK